MANDCLEIITSVVCSVFDAYSAVLFLPAKSPQEFRIAASFSLGDEIDRNTVIAPGKGLVGWIIRNRRPLLINDFDRKRNRLGYYKSKEEDRIKAFMGCPLRNTEGALCLDSKRTYSFSEKDQKILDLFSILIAQLHSDACRVEQNMAEHTFYRGLKAIHELKSGSPRWSEYLGRFLDLTSQTTGFEYAFLAARDERGEGYFLEGFNKELPQAGEEAKSRFPIKSGIIGWVFNNQSPVYVDEKNPGPAGASLFGKEVKAPKFASVVCLPLKIHKRTRGVFVLADQRNLSMGEETRTYLEMAAGDLALFLENLYLKNRLTEPATKS
jgi:signal transduction protein with GAF and PtsI domain